VDTPYRSAPRADDVEAPRDAGIAGEVIGQFADPLAFYRELVQNAIDAGTPEVEVEVGYDDGGEVVRAVVRDRGEGMDRAIIEDQLLVLFRSTKERDPTKIGKFGIGFASVLAPGPRVVTVSTVRDGRRLILHLYPDLAYELFDGGLAARAGTSVELELPMAADEVARFARRSRAALERWCRHASVPIHFRARGRGGAALDDARIDRPLGLDGALVEVRGTSSDGQCVAVVGVLPEARAACGFFNHGLTLRETDERLLGRLAFKVQDGRLGHTISRDDVRRDAAFTRAVAHARALAEEALPGAAAAAVRAAAEAGDHDRYRALVDALADAQVRVPAGAWVVPLLAPHDGRRALAIADLPRPTWGAQAATPITAALVESGTPVVALGRDPHWLAARLSDQLPSEIIDANAELTLVTPVEATDEDLRLLAVLGELLAAAGRGVGGIALGGLDGAHARTLALACDRDGDAGDGAQWLIRRERGGREPFGPRPSPIVLGVDHPLVAKARARAGGDPIGPASILARAILLRWDALDVERSHRLLAATVERLGADVSPEDGA